MSVRAEVANARAAARADPGWLRGWYWPLWLVVVALGFAIPEALALLDPGRGGTLSERTRAWLGVEPARPRRRWALAGLAAVLVAFAAWFPLHLLSWWPWEH